MRPMLSRINAVLVAVPLFLMPLGSIRAQEHSHPHPHQDHQHGDHHHTHGDSNLLTIEHVLAMKQNRGLSSTTPMKSGVSGTGEMAFEVLVTAKNLPKKVFEPNPFGRGKKKQPILNYAHGGFAYDHREGKGEVYWFLQGAGMMRVNRDRSKIDLLKTDPKHGPKFNMHNATFFVHKGNGRIAWPANSGAKGLRHRCRWQADPHDRSVRRSQPYSRKPKPAGYCPHRYRLPRRQAVGHRWLRLEVRDVLRPRRSKEWTGTIFGGRNMKKPEAGEVRHQPRNHDPQGSDLHRRTVLRPHSLLQTRHEIRQHVPASRTGRSRAISSSSLANDTLYGVAASLNTVEREQEDQGDKGAAVYIVDMKTLKVVSTIKPKDELGLAKFSHLHNVFPSVDEDGVTLFCQAWNVGDFAILRQSKAAKEADVKKIK